MIKTLATPQESSYTVDIPNNYIGKQIEILIYSLDEIADVKPAVTKKTMANFWGVLGDTTANDLREKTEKSRASWEDRLSKQF
jgi:hypothetical protein